MANKTKFFRVAVEGDTIDGRVIERAWIEQAAKSYSQDVYGARIWVEHLRGIMPDSSFRAYGDVMAVKSEEIDFNGSKKLALFAQLDATPDLVEMNKKRQKIFTSIEIDPNFQGKGSAYLVGLAVTDSPASIGTEKLSFSSMVAKFGENSKTNLFSTAIETEMEFEDDSKNMFVGMIQKFSEFFTPQIEKQGEEAKQNFSDVKQVLEQIAETFSKQNTAFSTIEYEFNELKTKFTSLEQKYNELSEAFHSHPDPNHQKRPESTGNAGTSTAVVY